VLDEIVVDRPAGTVATTSSFPVKLGTTAAAEGPFLTVTGRDIVLTASGTQLTARIRVRLVQRLPEGSTFSLGVVDHWGRVDRISRSVELAEPAKGFSWGTLAAAVVGALFAGTVVGGFFASRRRPSTRPSVYGLVQRRMEEQRARS
jgi:hypothetical protein